MVSKDVISKSLSDAIFKCSPSAKARSIGASVKEKEYTNTDGVKVVEYIYEDGTVINRKLNKKVTVVEESGYSFESETDMFDTLTYDGVEYHLSYGTSTDDKATDDFFKYQEDIIREKYGDDGWDFFSRYCNEYGTFQGWNLNSVLRGYRSMDDVTDKDGKFYISPFLLENHNRFVEMEKSLPLDRESFVSLRLVNKLHRNDSIGKKIVSDKGHISTSTIGELENYEVYGDYMNGWFVFTVNEKGSGVNGAYFGRGVKYDDGYDWEREVNYVPNQKFERVLIDEENRFIIQKPID